MAAHKLSLSVQYAVGKAGLPTRQQFRRWIKAALQCDVQTVLRIVDEIEGCALNKQFRGKRYLPARPNGPRTYVCVYRYRPAV